MTKGSELRDVEENIRKGINKIERRRARREAQRQAYRALMFLEAKKAK